MTEPAKMKKMQDDQSGVVILEVLVAIVIFAVGVLGIIGLQTVTAKAGVDARFRTDAAALSDELVARVQTWIGPTTLTAQFTGTNNSGGAEYMSWYTNRLSIARSGLPGVQSAVAFPAPYAGTNVGVFMTVVISWQVPGADGRSSHTTVAALPGGG